MLSAVTYACRVGAGASIALILVIWLHSSLPAVSFVEMPLSRQIQLVVSLKYVGRVVSTRLRCRVQRTRPT